MLVSSLSSGMANSNVNSQWTMSGGAQATYSTPTVFKVRPLEMNLCESFNINTGVCNGTNDVTFTPTIANDGICDIAAVAPGSVACSAGGTEDIPTGVTFNYMRVKIDRTMWLQGSVPSSSAVWQNGDDYDGSIAHCVTSSSNTNTNGTSAPEGTVLTSAGGEPVPTEQAIFFSNGPGNEDETGDASNASWATASGNSGSGNSGADACNPDWDAINLGDLSSLGSPCSFVSITTLDNAGYTNSSSSGGGNYTYTMDYSTTWSNAESLKIWQGRLTASSEGLVMIYKLSSPFTRTLKDVSPLLKMSFDVTNALRAQFTKYTADEDADGTEVCTLDVGDPQVTITITE
tara:strand:- start:108 stop:1145 length:1038 start_codon:yes stop_codon:yes gene_type:complete